MRAIFLAAALSLTASAASAAPADGPVRYRLSPVFTDERLTALAVEIRFAGDRDGETVVNLPDDWAGEKELYRLVEDVTVDGAKLERPEPARLVLRHRPGRELTVRYRVRSGYDGAPSTGQSGGNPYRPIVAGYWFSAIGTTVFAAPEGDGDGGGARPASFAWGVFPFGWRLASDLEREGLKVDDVGESVLVGGANLNVRSLGGSAAPVRVAVLGDWGLDWKAFDDKMGRIAAASSTLWNDGASPFLIAVTPLAARADGRSLGGTGLGDAFSLYASTNTPDAELPWLLAHEHLHAWLPRAIGGLSDKDEALGYWLSEGFTNFYTGRVLLRSGVWTLDQYVGDFNQRLQGYWTSPGRTFSNAQVAEGFWTDPRVKDMPYQRGMVIAALWDGRLRAASGGARDLDDLMLAMKGPAVAGDEAPVRLARLAPGVGLELGDDLARYVDRGEMVSLPADLFAPCARVETVSQAGFDAGFDTSVLRDPKPAARAVTPSGPAFAAGLREGDLLLGWSIFGGDTTRDIELTVRSPAAGAPQRDLRYRPLGAPMPVQRLVLAEGLSALQREACARFMSGEAPAPVLKG
ncbi:hypothetical protein [Caulobacter sp. 17J65-9]|uniref:M61 family metallopeptidase n=1 Tax=Caulobacter sp. 17J65-9 TaxID=2709382 RepID=UPI0013CDC196|nr:hypothetical protein [Caulobacter sp. 17J65-9]NEX95210.1 hypothetical protein [Caulobacter sp. 17J65-9]